MTWLLEDTGAPSVRDAIARTTLKQLREESRELTIDGRDIRAVGRMGGVTRWRATASKLLNDTVLELQAYESSGVER